MASVFVQYAPYQLAEGTWDDKREALGDRCIEVFAQYAPNIKDLILHRQVVTPLDMERDLRADRRKHHAGGDGPGSARTDAAGLPHADPGALSVWRGFLPRRRYHWGLWTQCRPGDPPWIGRRKAAGIFCQGP